jgi:hypothetical protein
MMVVVATMLKTDFDDGDGDADDVGVCARSKCFDEP